VRQPGAPGASHGLAAREVSAAAGLAAGLAWEGSLAENRALHLYYLAAAAQAQGRLELETERGRFTLHFKRGGVEHASSDAPEDDLGKYLVARGVISEEARAEGERARAEAGGDLVTALASRRLMNPAESFRAIQEHGAAVVARALGCEKGTARFTPGVPPPPSSFPIGARWGLLCEAVRRLDGLAVRKLLGPRVERIASRAGGRIELGELKLTALEARTVALFDGGASPAQLAAAHPADGEVLLRVALLLAETELLSFGSVTKSAPPLSPQSARPLSPALSPPGGVARETTSSAPQAASSSARPSPRPDGGVGGGAPDPEVGEAGGRSRQRAEAPKALPPAGRGGGTASSPPLSSVKPPAPAAPKPAVDEAALRVLHDRIVKADHFEALGVKRDAPAAQVKTAYFQLARLYHPDAGAQGEPEAVKRLRADIFARLGEAWGVLSDEARRAEYLQKLASGGDAEVDASAIFEAEELFRRATLLVKARQYDAAREALAGAVKLNADEPEFGVWAAWVEFLTATDRKRQHAASAAVMEAALEKVPRCMAAHLFLGQMAKIVGDLALAEKRLKRGLALDPEHAELTRELKYLRK